jgi:hypothetical protein
MFIAENEKKFNCIGLHIDFCFFAKAMRSKRVIGLKEGLLAQHTFEFCQFVEDSSNFT